MPSCHTPRSFGRFPRETKKQTVVLAVFIFMTKMAAPNRTPIVSRGSPVRRPRAGAGVGAALRHALNPEAGNLPADMRRSDGRRDGKEGVSSGRYRVSPDRYSKQKKKNT